MSSSEDKSSEGASESDICNCGSLWSKWTGRCSYTASSGFFFKGVYGANGRAVVVTQGCVFSLETPARTSKDITPDRPAVTRHVQNLRPTRRSRRPPCPLGLACKACSKTRTPPVVKKTPTTTYCPPRGTFISEARRCTGSCFFSLTLSRWTRYFRI